MNLLFVEIFSNQIYTKKKAFPIFFRTEKAFSLIFKVLHKHFLNFFNFGCC